MYKDRLRPLIDRVTWPKRKVAQVVGALACAVTATILLYQNNSEPAPIATKVYVECPKDTKAVAFNGLPNDNTELIACIGTNEQKNEPLSIDADPTREPYGMDNSADFYAWCSTGAGKKEVNTPAIVGDTLVSAPDRNVIKCRLGLLVVNETPNNV